MMGVTPKTTDPKRDNFHMPSQHSNISEYSADQKTSYQTRPDISEKLMHTVNSEREKIKKN
jgi:hypothetical protein